MIAFSAFCTLPQSALVFAAAILLVFLNTFLFALSFRRNLGTWFACVACVRVVLGMVFLTILLDGIYRLDYLPYAREYNAAVQWLYRLPTLYIVLAQAGSAVLSAALIAYLIRTAPTRLSEFSVKNALDDLPIGICIGEENGTILLSNLKMNELANRLIGTGVTDMLTLWNAIETGGTKQNGQTRVQSGDAVFVCTRDTLEMDGRRFLQIVALDRSEQYRAVQELEKKNAQLRDYQVRLKAYRVQQESIIMQQKNLKTRAMIHTQLGGLLLTGKYYLEHPDAVDERELLQMLHNVNKYLLEETDTQDEFDAALRMADRIGVRVCIDGSVPDREPYRSVLGQAVAEVSTNAVKHACGDQVNVVISDTDDAISFTLTNNGDAPAAQIRASGGLLTLRQTVLQLGGEMDLQSTPVFALTVTFRKPDKA